MRRKIVAGNWKMNLTPFQAVELCELLKPLVKDAEAEIVFCVPAIDIPAVV
ncbi:MAG: triose-phosphate isomerase, partial [Clostridia bacterium]|nr:triose-phosphate isomerase [Clostridia bacterium]